MRAMHIELPHGDSEKPALYTLAETLHDTPNGFASYDYAKSVWLGSPDRQQRLASEHPWPSRVHDGQEYTYSVPVLAGVSPEIGTVLFIGKDNWHPDDDPHAWLVAERHLVTGEERDHIILSSSVDAARRLWLQVAPGSYTNMPPQMRDALTSQPRYAQHAFVGKLDQNYHLSEAVLREAYNQRDIEYEDYEALESMIRMVYQIHEARAESEREILEARALSYALGRRAVK